MAGVIQRARDEGVERGIEQGIARGIERGIEQGIQESIQEVLALRFDAEEAQQLASRIGAIDDVPRLKQLHRAAIQVPSLAAFRDRLEADNGDDAPPKDPMS